MINRRLKLCWGNFNWGFLFAMLVGFATVIAVIVAVGSLIKGML